MNMKKFFKLGFSIMAIAFAMLGLTGCQGTATKGALDSDSAQGQVQKRNYQSRAFDTKDKNTTVRTVIATLQDLGFVVDKADDTLGSVTATKFTHNVPLKMTVSVRPRGDQLVVRANAQYGIKPVNEPESYQDFFTSLAKSMFLDAHEVA
jgi:hypothetical protein